MTTDELISTLQHLERELHQKETRRDPSRMDMLLHPEFQGFGRTGHRYSRAEVVTEFSACDVEFPTVISWGLSVAIIAEHIALLTYVSAHQDKSCTPSDASLVAVGTAEGWQVRFHQGTPTNENEQSAT